LLSNLIYKSIDSAAQDVQAAISIATKTLLQSMTIPPNYRKINPADPPILVLGARSETLPLTSINDYLDRFLAQQVAQVPGVAQSQIGGDRRPSIRIQVDPAKLAAIGLTLEEIRTAIVNSTTNAPNSIRTRSALSLRPTTRLLTQTRSMTSYWPTAMAVQSACAMSAWPSPTRRTVTWPATRTMSLAFY
jgi:multidrug efflux pump subunit AcrB